MAVHRDMMARFREAKKQEIKALERKVYTQQHLSFRALIWLTAYQVQAKKDKVKQVQEQQQKQTMKHDARGSSILSAQLAN